MMETPQGEARLTIREMCALVGVSRASYHRYVGEVAPVTHFFGLIGVHHSIMTVPEFLALPPVTGPTGTSHRPASVLYRSSPTSTSPATAQAVPAAEIHWSGP